MKLKYVSGDLVQMFADDQIDIMIHGCNCFHTMGSGIARQIASKYPQALLADKSTPYGDESKLGSMSICKIPNKGLIVNAYTQFAPGAGNDVVEYAALYHAFKKIFENAYNIANAINYQSRIGIPMIGAGLAGGDWETIEWLIEKANRQYNVDITCVVLAFNN